MLAGNADLSLRANLVQIHPALRKRAASAITVRHGACDFDFDRLRSGPFEGPATGKASGSAGGLLLRVQASHTERWTDGRQGVAAVHQHPHPFADAAKSLVGDFDFDVIAFAVFAHSKSPLGFSYANRGSHIAVTDASSFSGILPVMSDQTRSPRSTREPELTIVGVSIEAVKSMASILPEIGRMLPLVYPIYKLVQIGFARRPKLTWSITVVLLACATGGTVYLVKGFLAANEREELLKAQNATYTAQIDELNRVEASLRTLMEFVSQQKTTLSESKATLDRMREEEQQLRPIVEADRKVVEAVLAARAQQDVRRTWADRGIGFGLGLLASFLATLLYDSVRNSLRSPKEKTGNTAT